jgi:hypothetical protein
MLATDCALPYSRDSYEESVIAMPEPAVVVPPVGPPRLSHDELAAAQKETLSAPRRKYGVAARALFVTLDIVYGKPRPMSKFKVVEIVARVPYQTLGARCLHRDHPCPSKHWPRQGDSKARSQQDNELWHLLILQDLLVRRGVRESRLKFF